VSKLLQRLSDPKRSGVYRSSHADDVVEATRGSPLDVVRIDASGDPIQAIASALAFPDWFGRNWDALEDSLADLSWRKAKGHVLLLEGVAAGDGAGILVDVLRAAAAHWTGQSVSFFAVLLDPQRKLDLPDLYRET
jgi:hypothetical protein